jgi:sulfite exporter TauE/SafE
MMGVFWLGTVPVMLGLGLGWAVLSAPLRRYLPAACAVAMIVVGLFSVAGRVRAHDPPSAVRDVVAPSSHHHAPR